MIRSKIAALNILIILCMVVFVSSVGFAQSSTAPQGDARSFFGSIVGEWIGTCEQSTDGQKAENKYFHAIVKQVDANTFSSQFEYYRYDESSSRSLRMGDSTVVTTIGKDGVAQNKITGKGIILVNDQPKNQELEFTETLTSVGADSFNGAGSGKICVDGMPFGLGKNGKIQSVKSEWSLKNGVLSLDQTIKVGFRALVFTKTFNVAARYTARHGSNVASLMTKGTQTVAGL